MSQMGVLNTSKFVPGIVVQHLTGNSGGSISPDLGNNINIVGGNNIAVAGTPLTSTLTINVTGTTDHAVQVGNATGSLTSIPVGTSGLILTGNTGANPSWQVNPGVFTWTTPVGNFNLVKNNGYFCDDIALQVATLPAVAAVGDTFKVVSINTGGWQIVQNAGQWIAFGDVSTTPGVGSLSSTKKGDTVELVCYVANEAFWIISSVGNIEYI